MLYKSYINLKLKISKSKKKKKLEKTFWTNLFSTFFMEKRKNVRSNDVR